jgi:DNA repair protein RadC
MRVKDLPEADRPRERLLRQGPEALSDRELLALVLGAGLPGCDAIELAARLIDQRGGLVGLAAADAHSLKCSPGVGPARAARLAAAFELARWATRTGPRRTIRGSADLAAAAAPFLSGLRHERVVVIACDHAGGILRVMPLTEGPPTAA